MINIPIAILLLLLCSCVPFHKQQSNLAYSEIINEKDGSVLMLVPAGEFTMGSNDLKSDSKPRHIVKLDSYYIGKYDVTVGQFRRFVAATSYVTDAEKSGGAHVLINLDWQQKSDASWRNPYFDQSDSCPVVCVSWNDAMAYCIWAGLRLPTEAEWEKAARGTDGRKYPWGDIWDPTRGNASETGNKRTLPVGSFPAGVSPYGCYDMAGNVWNWCSDWYDSTSYYNSPSSNPSGPSTGTTKVEHGGSWGFVASNSCSAVRFKGPPDSEGAFFGFRVAR